MEVRDLKSSDFEIAQDLIEGFSAPHIARRLNLSERAAGARIRVIFAKLGVSNREELRHRRRQKSGDITTRGFAPSLRPRGHSRVPEDYWDEHGPLDGLVGNIRLHHSGRSCLGEGPPPRGSEMYPGVDWEADLDRLDGWSWDVDDPSEFPLLRSRRHATRVISELGLEGGDEADYVRGVTAALRESGQPPWPRMRGLVKDKEIDPSAAVVADFFPNRHRSFLGVILSPEGHPFGFCLLFFGDPDDPSSWSTMKLHDWRQLSEPEARKPYEDQILIGMNVLKRA
jgi:DNA-binding CsgD family transcriptional regulator